MLFLVKLAWKNLSRYKRRTLITSLSLAIGLALFIFTDSLLMGMEEETETNLINYETSSARILHQDYWEEKDQLSLKHRLESPEKILQILQKKNIPATPRINFQGEMVVYQDPYPESGSLMTRVVAIDPRKDDQVFKMQDTLVRGEYLKKDGYGVLMGEWMAQDLGADVGYPLTIITRTKDGYYQTIDAEITGIINTPNPIINKNTLFISLETASEYLEMKGSVTEINLHFPRDDREKQRAAALEKELHQAGFNSLEVRPWQDIAEDFTALAQTKTAGSKIILMLVFVIAAVGVSNTMLMAVYERIRELGTMRAMGMSDRAVWGVFLLEAAGIGLLGALMGILAGVLINIPLVYAGIDMSAQMEGMDVGYRTTGIMRGTWNLATIGIAFYAGIVLTVLVSVFPTRKAMKMEITECLKSE